MLSCLIRNTVNVTLRVRGLKVNCRGNNIVLYCSRSKGLDAREPVPTVEIHPVDARRLGVKDGDHVMVISRRNAIRIAARISHRVGRHQVFVPFHFREAAANLLTNPVLDAHAKIPSFKVCAVRLEKAD